MYEGNMQIVTVGVSDWIVKEKDGHYFHRPEGRCCIIHKRNRFCGYCQLKPNWAAFLLRARNLHTEQSMSYECVYCRIFGQIHLT